MQIKTILLTVCFGIILSPGFAASPAAETAASSTSDKDHIVPPTPVVIVSPVRLPWEYETAAVKIELMVDEYGHPSHVEVAEIVPTDLRELVISAVEKWRFSPATRNRKPVSVRVILPLNLVTN